MVTRAESFTLPHPSDDFEQYLVGDNHRVAVVNTVGSDKPDPLDGATIQVLYRSIDRSHPQAEVIGPVSSQCTVLSIGTRAIDCAVGGAVISVSLRSHQHRTVYEPPGVAVEGTTAVAMTVLGGRVAWETPSGAGRIALLSSG